MELEKSVFGSIQELQMEIEKKKSKLNVLQKNNETLAEELREEKRKLREMNTTIQSNQTQSRLLKRALETGQSLEAECQMRIKFMTEKYQQNTAEIVAKRRLFHEMKNELQEKEHQLTNHLQQWEKAIKEKVTNKEHLALYEECAGLLDKMHELETKQKEQTYLQLKAAVKPKIQIENSKVEEKVVHARQEEEEKELVEIEQASKKSKSEVSNSNQEIEKHDLDDEEYVDEEHLLQV